MNMNFSPYKTLIYPTIKWEKRLALPLLRHLIKPLFFVFIISLFLYIFGPFINITNPVILQKLLGLSIVSLILSVIIKILKSFFAFQAKILKHTTSLEQAINAPEKYNLAEFLSSEIIKAIDKSFRFIKIKKLSKINSTIFFYFLLRDNPKLNFIFSRALLSIKDIENIIQEHFKTYKKAIIKNLTKNNVSIFEKSFSKDFQDTIFESLKIAQQKKHQRVEIGDILIALTKHNLIFQEIINTSDIKIDDIKYLVQWLEFLEQKIEKRRKFWERENLIKRGSLAKNWVAGFTMTLDRFSIDLSEQAKKRVFTEQAIGHQKEVKAIERILVRQESDNDVLLVGEPGVGKKGIIQILALKSLLGQTLPELNYKRIVALDIPAILTQTENRDEFQVILDKIFQETADAGNVILVINNFHNFVRTENRPGIIDITGILSSYLPLSQFQVIAITTYKGLHKYIETKSSILNLFEKVEVSEISQRETLMVLENLALLYEQRYKKLISYSALRQVITLTDRYIPFVPFPKKAIGLLDEVMVYMSSIKEKIVLPKHIAKIISQKTKIPVGKIEFKEKEILLNLEKLIHKRIINQEEAVREISTALRRARAEVTVQKGPMGTFLFLGPTGVGKTETAKALAEIYFGSEKKMIRLDMSEFQNITDISRLIGSIEGDGLLTTQVRENPFSIILLDEIEKAHPNLLNLFLQVLDEGHLTDGWGRKIDFKNTIIIATSNAGYQIILQTLKQMGEWSGVKQKLLDYIFEKAIFRPEFINRFDGVIVFKPLTKNNLLDIAELILQKMKENLKEKNIEFIITEPLKEKIVEKGYDPIFGARNLKRVIQDKVENPLSEALLKQELKRGCSVSLELTDKDEFKIKIKNKE